MSSPRTVSHTPVSRAVPRRALPRPRTHVLLGAASAALLAACVVPESGLGIPVTPQRPTVSYDIATTAPGSLELETGLALDPGDRAGTPTVLKYGLDTRSEAFVGLEPLVVQDSGDDTEVGVGDLQLGVRHRFLEPAQGRPGVAGLALVKLPTADDDKGIGSGKADAFGAVSASWPHDGWTGIAYVQLGVLGDPGGGITFEGVTSLTAGVPLRHDLAAFGELAGLWQPEHDTERLLATLGVAKTWAPGRVIDLGFAVGVGDDAPDLQLLVGTTINLGPPVRLQSLRR